MFRSKDNGEGQSETRQQREVLCTLREWAKQFIKPEEFKYLFLTKYEGGRTVWHAAAGSVHPELLGTLWEWAKLFLSPEGIKQYFHKQR
jgi:hypothetical protein